MVPFRRNEIVVEHHAVGWMMEFLFVDYWIVGDSTPETSAGGTGGSPTSATSGPTNQSQPSRRRGPAQKPRPPNRDQRATKRKRGPG